MTDHTDSANHTRSTLRSLAWLDDSVVQHRMVMALNGDSVCIADPTRNSGDRVAAAVDGGEGKQLRRTVRTSKSHPELEGRVAIDHQLDPQSTWLTCQIVPLESRCRRRSNSVFIQAQELSWDLRPEKCNKITPI